MIFHTNNRLSKKDLSKLYKSATLSVSKDKNAIDKENNKNKHINNKTINKQ